MNAEAAGVPQVTPKIQNFDPAIVVRNPAIAARSGEPSDAKIARYVENMLERREAGREHQIMPGVVRILNDGTVECVVGWHRCSAERRLNENLADVMDPFYFQAVAVPSTDEQALLDAIDENLVRENSSIFDMGAAMAKLSAIGYTQDQIGKKFGKKPSTVSEYIRCADLPKKIKQAHESGKMDEGALILLARYNKDRKLQEELFEDANSQREAREAIIARADARANGTEVPPAGGEEAEEDTTSGKEASKVPVSEAVKGKKRRGQGKTIGKDVQAAVKKRGAAKRKSTGAEKKGRSKTDLMKFWQSIAGENVTDEDCPETYREFAKRQEMFLDEAISEAAFKNTVKKCFAQKFQG